MPDIIDDTCPNVRSTSYIIIESKSRCLRCNLISAVFAFALPAGYESLSIDDDTPEDEIDTWEALGIPAILAYVDHLPEAVSKRIRALTPHYRIDLDNETGQTYWINHCEHCGAQMEEQELHGELDGPFGPMSYEGLEAIRLHEVCESFEAQAGGERHTLMHVNG